MARAHGARAVLAAAFETTYGTAPASGYTRLPFASMTLGAEQPLLDSELLGYGRDPLAPIKDALTADGDISVPVDALALGFWLKAAFGSPTTTGTSPGPYTHTFASGGWTLPSLSIEKQHPEVPDFVMYSGVRLNTLAWTMQRSGLLTATVGLIAQGETPDTSTNAGTLADLELIRFGHFNGAVKRNGTTIGNIVSASVSYSNGLDPIETIRSDGKIDGVDAGMASLSGEVVVRFADTVLRDQAISGDPCALEFSYTTAGDESFSFTAHAVYLPRPRIEVPGPQGIQATFAWQAAKASSPARMCTAVLVNDRASY